MLHLGLLALLAGILGRHSQLLCCDPVVAPRADTSSSSSSSDSAEPGWEQLSETTVWNITFAQYAALQTRDVL